jgi:hypothetical protein
MKYQLSLFTVFAGMLLSTLLQAQPPVQIEMGTVLNASGQPVSDGIMIYGAESLKKNVTYADIKGSPYLNDSFRVTLLYDKGNNLMGKVLTRLNIHSFQLHYLDKAGQELVIGPDAVQRIVYVHPMNEQITLQEFVTNVGYLNTKYNKQVFVQAFNSGNTRLLKYIHKELGTYDSLMGQFKRYMFVRREDYYIQKQSTVEPLRKLNKERVLAFTRHENELTALATQQQLDFKKEEDVAVLLNYLNSLVVKKM